MILSGINNGNCGLSPPLITYFSKKAIGKMGRLRVWNALRKIKPERTPRGEILIAEAFLKEANTNLEAFLEEIEADLLTLPVNYRSQVDWQYWCRKGYFTFALIDGPFNTLIQSLGWARAAEWIVKKPATVRSFMGKYLKAAWEVAAGALDGGCEGLILGDDLAGQNDLLVDPVFLRKYYFPELRCWLKKIPVVSTPVLFHSDGNVAELIPDLRGVGFWGLQGLQPDAGMSKAILPEELVDDWVWWGSLQFEGRLGLKGPAQLSSEAVQLCRQWQGVPGYIFGSCGGLYSGLPLELVKAAYLK